MVYVNMDRGAQTHVSCDSTGGLDACGARLATRLLLGAMSAFKICAMAATRASSYSYLMIGVVVASIARFKNKHR